MGLWNLIDLETFFDTTIIKATTLKIKGGSEFALTPMSLNFLTQDSVRNFHQNLHLYPAVIDKQLQPLTTIMSWLRPTLSPFLDQAFSDYLHAKSSEILSNELILQSSKYEPVYCPEYFEYSHAVDTGSGSNRGIFPNNDELRRLCDCCLATEALHNDGEAECSLYCVRSSDPTARSNIILPRPALIPSTLELPMCYNHSLFNETHNSKYQYGCLKADLPGSFDCVALPVTTSYINSHSVLPMHIGMSVTKETWSIVGIVIAIAFALTVVAIITIVLVLRWRSRRPRSAYKVLSTEPPSTTSETILEH